MRDDSPKTAAVLIIGNEILTGRTQDANVAYIAKKLMETGVRLMQVRVVPDVEQDIVDNVNVLRTAYDYVFTSGGLGPTHDDITAASIAKAFDVALPEHAEARARLLKHYGSEAMLTPARLLMARIPQGAALIDNPVSAAPGFQIGNVYVLAGVPKIMQAMLDGVLPKIKGGPPIMSRSVGCLLPESRLATDLGALATRYPDIDIGSYPYFRLGGYGLSLVARGTDAMLLDKVMNDLCQLIVSLGGEPVLLDDVHPAAQSA